MIKFTIPTEPVAQGRPRAVKRGNRIMMYDPLKSKEYKKYVSLIAKQYTPGQPLELPLVINLKIYRPIPKSTSKKKREQMNTGAIRPTVKPDTDNYAKAILDALNGIIYKDDSQVVDLNASKYYSENPRVEVEIIPINTTIF